MLLEICSVKIDFTTSDSERFTNARVTFIQYYCAELFRSEFHADNNHIQTSQAAI